jgi:hypothetical protein
VIAGCATGPNVRGASMGCPIDQRLDETLSELMHRYVDTVRAEALRRAGAGLTVAQVASIAFEGAPIERLESAAGAA